MTPDALLADYLDVITGRGQGDGWIEVRYRHAGGMRTRFYPARGRHRALEQRVTRLGETRDVYVGCALRRAQRGDRDHVGQAWTLWAECDGPHARAALDAFEPSASLLIASGSPGHVHAYWALEEPIAAATLEDANRRLAEAVGGDPVCYDAARILRPPGTRNHKHAPSRPVRQIGRSRGEPYALTDVLAVLPPSSLDHVDAVEERAASSDPLLAIQPADYVATLTGENVGRDHKVSCPSHRDRTPSLHVYPTPERGWHCYGCRRGGSIYDLAAAVWQLQTRGGDFLTVKQRLERMFL